MARTNFGSKLGIIAAAAGSAVGLGNIWRFPYELGQQGGGAFLLVYLLCVLLLGLPIMLSELLIGRMGQSNVTGAFRSIGHPRWRFIGYAGVLCSFLIMGFYCVVAGWTIEYIWQAITNQFADKSTADLAAAFADFSTRPIRPIMWMFLFVAITCYVILAGVQNGIEKSAKILMPILFVLLLVLCMRSLTLPGGMEGLAFLFRPDFSKITPEVVLSAMGQAFFSLSLGMGCMITYGSYIDKKNNLEHTALQVTGLDTLVAILAAIAIFPAVFALGINPAQGPELVFITLPNVFAHIPGGYIWAIAFFVLLSIAALTSTISLLEVITAFMNEEWKLSRRKAAIIASCIIAVLGVFASLSLGLLKDYTIAGMSFFDLLDNFTAKFLMPIGGLAIAVFCGWVLDKKRIEAELSNEGKLKLKYLKVFAFLLKYITPLAILAIFIDQLR